jgi:hypothetical protein
VPPRGISVISLAGMTSQMKNNSKPTSDFGAKCEKCETINTVTLEKGEVKMEGAGFADVSTLPPGDDSAFSITLLGLPEKVDHYTLFPSGTLTYITTNQWKLAELSLRIKAVNFGAERETISLFVSK